MGNIFYFVFKFFSSFTPNLPDGAGEFFKFMENFSLIDGNFYAMDWGNFLKFMLSFFKKIKFSKK
jgi:hypothetical protein